MLELAFEEVHVSSSLTIIVFPYVDPAVANVLEITFEKIDVGSSVTIVVFPYVAPAVT